MSLAQEDDGPSTKQEHKLPLARVKRLIKAESDVSQLTAEAAALIAKATELFLETFARQAAKHMVNDSRVTLRYKDVAAEVKEEKRLQFLLDVVPEQVTVRSLANGQDASGSNAEASESESEGGPEDENDGQEERT